MRRIIVLFSFLGICGSVYMLILILTSSSPPSSPFGAPFIYLSMAAAIASFLGGGAMYGLERLVPLILSLPLYLIMSPVWLIMMPLFSFAQLHDVSWGTKEGGTATVLAWQAEQCAKSADARADAARSLAKDAALSLVGEAQSPSAAARSHALALLPGGAAAVSVAPARPAPPAESQLDKDPLRRRAVKRGVDSDAEEGGGGEAYLASGTTPSVITDGGGGVTTTSRRSSAAAIVSAAAAAEAVAADARLTLHAALAEVEEAASEAACARAAAEQLSRDRDHMSASYSSFRTTALITYLVVNGTLVIVTLASDPTLTHFSTALAFSVLFFTGFRLIGSALFQLSRLLRALSRSLCGCFYRIEVAGTRGDRIVCCARRMSYYSVDDAWASEHSHEVHIYPQWAPPAKQRARRTLTAIGEHMAATTAATPAPPPPPPFRASDALGPFASWLQAPLRVNASSSASV